VRRGKEERAIGRLCVVLPLLALLWRRLCGWQTIAGRQRIHDIRQQRRDQAWDGALPCNTL